MWPNIPADYVPLIQNLLILAAVLGVVFAATTVLGTRHGIERLLARSPGDAAGGASLRRGGSALERFLSFQIARRFVPSGAQERTGLKQWLLQAGYASSRASETYYAVRIVLAIALPLVAVLCIPIFAPGIGTGALGIEMLSAAFGFMLPVFWVNRRRKSRQRRMREGLPDILDLLLVCTEAGLGLDMAIAKVGEEVVQSQPLLAENLQGITTEVRAGRSRPDAMRGFANRCGVAEATSLVNLLIQSDALGTSMATALRVFADDMRSHRLLKAEEMAQKVTVKLSLVLVGCFMPALVGAIVAPVIFNIVRTWKGLPFK
jgi:tight adherence protein C